MKSTLIKQAIWFAIALPFAGAIAWGNGGLLNIAHLLLALLAILGICAAAMTLSQAHTADKGEGEKRATAIKYVRGMLERLDSRSALAKAWDWVQSISLFLAAAYTGLIATGVLYGIAIVWSQIGVIVARETLKKIDATAEAAA